MRAVWKFVLDHGVNKIAVPRPWKIVHVDTDPFSRGTQMPCVWIEVNTEPNAPGAEIELAFVGTGHLIPENSEHVGSTITSGGLVWHVYRIAS
jgi:hypothetical protein